MGQSVLLGLAVFLPGLVFAGIGVGWLLGWEPRERLVARVSAMCYLVATCCLAALGCWMAAAGQNQCVAELGNWFAVEHYEFPLVLSADRLSLPLLTLSAVLVGVVSVFSARYLHREPGFLRFFLLLNLFGFGALLLFAAGSFDLLIVGWELVGLTSVLLIAFFQHRDEPVRNALRVFAVYRGCDVGLLTAVVLMHHHAGTASFSSLFPGDWPSGGGPLTGGWAAAIGALLLLAAMGKAAQVPFSGWLPRAMEGPTPSSAIFYGALSVHAGAYLLLRAQPILAQSAVLSGAVVTVGVLTALHGTLAGRAAADAKTSLAHASVTQLGLIFVEIGLGWSWVAALHIGGHAAVRTLEFLRAPSMLHDYHRLHSASGGCLEKTGGHYGSLLPERSRAWLYRLAFDRSHLDTVLDRFALGPLLWLAGRLHHWESRWISWAFGPNRMRRARPPAGAAAKPPRVHSEGANA
jgi:NAD(P)H-quinone oxidoreductase subunit 5